VAETVADAVRQARPASLEPPMPEPPPAAPA
jgi:hypothetical protein